jgi:hypothetical protein
MDAGTLGRFQAYLTIGTASIAIVLSLVWAACRLLGQRAFVWAIVGVLALIGLAMALLGALQLAAGSPFAAVNIAFGALILAGLFRAMRRLMAG